MFLCVLRFTDSTWRNERLRRPALKKKERENNALGGPYPIKAVKNIEGMLCVGYYFMGRLIL